MSTTLTVTQLTNANGTGVYDLLVKTNKAILDEEYANGHIDGSAYAQLLVQLLQDTLGQASNFALKAETDAAQIALLECQAAACRKDIELKSSKLLTDELQRAKIVEDTKAVVQNVKQSVEQTKLIAEQKLNTIHERDEIDQRVNLIKKDVLLRVEQTKGEIAKVTLTNANTQDVLESVKVKAQQIKLYAAQTAVENKRIDVMAVDINLKNSETQLNNQRKLLMAQEILIKKEDVKIRKKELELKTKELEIRAKELLIKIEQVKEMKQRIEVMKMDIKLKGAEILLKKAEAALKEKQVDLAEKELEIREKELLIKQEEVLKIKAEVAVLQEEICSAKARCAKLKEEIKFITEKINTEKAQTSSAGGGILKAQETLYGAQAQAFTDKHYAALRKIDADVYSVQLSMDVAGAAWTPST